MSVEGNLITNLNSEATELRNHLSTCITMKSWEFFSCCALIWQTDVHRHKMALKVKDGSIKRLELPPWTGCFIMEPQMRKWHTKKSITFGANDFLTHPKVEPERSNSSAKSFYVSLLLLTVCAAVQAILVSIKSCTKRFPLGLAGGISREI